MSWIISDSMIPMGTSTRPVLLILPTRENILVPLLFSVPILVYQSAPLLTMRGTFAQVSTLFRVLGRFQRPDWVVCICLALGSPGFPSIDAIKAVDSPQTKAPPPLAIFTSKSKPEPSMFFPSRPYSLAFLIALLNNLTARGYSVRTYM